MTTSALYEGAVRHRRFAVRRHELHHRLALAYIDLDELPELLGGRLLAHHPGLVRFRRRDYLGAASIPLAEAVRERVRAQVGVRPCGPIRVLTQLRTWGHCFNPVSFYYCFDLTGERLQSVVAEVTNTPWGERHAYVLDRSRGDPDAAAAASANVLSGSVEKALHVSPFMSMDTRYEWRLTTPGRSISVHIASVRRGQLVFDATLALRRVELTRSSLAGASTRYPLATIRVLALIYAHAAALALKGVPLHPHPPVGAT